MSLQQNDITESIFESIDTIVADRIKQNNQIYNISQISDIIETQKNMNEYLQVKELDISKKINYKGKNIACGYQDSTFPYWETAIFSEEMIIASLTKTFTIKSVNNGYGGYYSELFYLPLPYPMRKITLTSNPIYLNDMKFFTIEASIENTVGLTFRIASFSAISSDTSVTLQLQLIGAIADVPRDPPNDFGSIDNVTVAYNPISIAKTYLQNNVNKKFKYGKNWLYGDSNVNIDRRSTRVRDNQGYAYSECDTFATLVLRGIRYSQSPYNMKNSQGKYITEFEENELAANPNNYAWVTHMNKLLLGQETPNGRGDIIIPDNTYPAYKYFQKNLYYAAEIAWSFWYNQAIFYDIKQVRTGDIAFWVRYTQDTHYFGNVTHVAIISEENNELYAYEVGYNYKDYPILRKIRLQDKNDMPTYYGRIEFY